MTSRIAIIAGGGRLPLLLADACRASGRDYVMIGLRGFAEETDLSAHPHDWNTLGRVGDLYDTLAKNNCSEVVMAGHVARPDFKNLDLDGKGMRLLPKVLRRARKGDDGLFKVLVEALEAEGLSVVGADEMLGTFLAPKGHITVKSPSEEDLADIERARDVVNALGALDIGQAVVVCRRLVLAVEAAEGTDAMLDRCIGLPSAIRGLPNERKGVLLKMPKPGQERRVDLPTIGLQTVRKASQAGLSGVAVAENASFILDQPKIIQEANDLDMFICGVRAH